MGKVEAFSTSRSFFQNGLIGVVGIEKEADIQDCYFNIQTSGQETAFFDPEHSDPDGGAEMGRTTAEMQMQSTYEGWDFESVWVMPENGGPPVLRNR